MKFVDQVRIRVRAGAGGDGCLSFHRTQHNPKGGPDGGNGGPGGDVVLEADPRATTLLEYRFPKAVFDAGRGGHGGSNDKQGRSGATLALRVPLGTEVTDLGSGELLGSLDAEGDRLVVARGGRGGRGNASYKSSRNRTPRRADPGTEGEERELQLDLKLLADAGLVGLPNAGKSTLLARVSAAKPIIADHPFSTRTPALGVVNAGSFESFVLADLPGLIEGAHRGVGLGHRFLRHVERAGLLVHLIDLSEPDGPGPVERYHEVSRELAAHRSGLERKPRLLVPTKIDVTGARESLELHRAELEALGHDLYPISAATGEGIERLVQAIHAHVRSAREEVQA